MLNLIYYDLKATIKKLWFYIVLGVVFAVFVRLVWSGMFDGSYADDNDLFYIASIVRYVSLGALGVIGFLISVAIIVAQTKWFDENILSPQGQLTNMLPVGSWQIILSKIITAFFWSIVLIAMIIGAASVFFVNTQRYTDIVSAITEILVSNNINISLFSIVFSTLLFIVTLVTLIITMCFSAQLIGQMFDVFRNLWVFISFALLVFVSYVVMVVFGRMIGSSIASIPTDIESFVNFAISTAHKFSFLNIFLVIVYWLFGSYILKRHLNLL